MTEKNGKSRRSSRRFVVVELAYSRLLNFPPPRQPRYRKADNSVRSTGGAIKVKNAKGEVVMEKVKVTRSEALFIPGNGTNGWA